MPFIEKRKFRENYYLSLSPYVLPTEPATQETLHSCLSNDRTNESMHRWRSVVWPRDELNNEPRQGILPSSPFPPLGPERSGETPAPRPPRGWGGKYPLDHRRRGVFQPLRKAIALPPWKCKHLPRGPANPPPGTLSHGSERITLKALRARVLPAASLAAAAVRNQKGKTEAVPCARGGRMREHATPGNGTRARPWAPELPGEMLGARRMRRREGCGTGACGSNRTPATQVHACTCMCLMMGMGTRGQA